MLDRVLNRVEQVLPACRRNSLPGFLFRGSCGFHFVSAADAIGGAEDETSCPESLKRRNLR